MSDMLFDIWMENKFEELLDEGLTIEQAHEKIEEILEEME